MADALGGPADNFPRALVADAVRVVGVPSPAGGRGTPHGLTARRSPGALRWRGRATQQVAAAGQGTSRPKGALAPGRAIRCTAYRLGTRFESPCDTVRVSGRRCGRPSRERLWPPPGVGRCPCGRGDGGGSGKASAPERRRGAGSSQRRRRADSNRCTRLCRPLPNHSATSPLHGHASRGRARLVTDRY